MKHLLNDMSQEEMNSIREQHAGGKKITVENFSNMVNKKLGEVPTLISEQSSNAKQVAGPFTKKFSNSRDWKLYIFQDGSKFYVYVTYESDKEPKLMKLNNGQGFPNQKEAQKEIDNIIENLKEVSATGGTETPMIESELDEQNRLKAALKGFGANRDERKSERQDRRDARRKEREEKREARRKERDEKNEANDQRSARARVLSYNDDFVKKINNFVRGLERDELVADNFGGYIQKLRDISNLYKSEIKRELNKMDLNKDEE